MKDASVKQFMKLNVLMIAFFLTLFARGVSGALTMGILMFPLWWLAEKIMSNTESSPFWKSIDKRDDFSRLPLQDDIDKIKGAKKGQKVKQAILEGRLKEQVYYTLKNEYNLSKEEIKVLAEDPESMTEKIDNEKLIEYLKNARDLNDLKKPSGEDQIELFSDGTDDKLESKKPKFEEKIKSAIEELERIQNVGKAR